MMYAVCFIGGIIFTFATSWLYNKMLDIYLQRKEDEDFLTDYFNQLEEDGKR